MTDDIDSQDIHRTADSSTERAKLTVDTLSDEQLRAVADAWRDAQDTDTPMANLRGAMTDSGLFDFMSKYETNNLELRGLATSAQDTLESRQRNSRKDELKHILAAVEGKPSYADKRTALSDLLGFRMIYDMDNLELDRFIADAGQELHSTESNEDQQSRDDQSVDSSSANVASTPDVTSKTTNRDMADQVSDLLNGQLAVNRADQVQYGAGATALGKKVGGQYVNESQLRDIVAHQDQIRDGLADRGEPDGSSGDQAPPASDPTTGDQLSGNDDEEATISGDEQDPEQFMQRFEAHNHPDEQPAEGGEPEEDRGEDSPERELTLSFVDQTHDAIAAARDAAEARRRNELQEGGRFKRMLKSIWMGENGIAGAYYLEKYKKEALGEIAEQNDILAHESNDLDARSRAQLATIDRFQSEYDESIHTEAGEKRQELDADSDFSTAMRDLIRRYATGEIENPTALAEERGRILQQLSESGHADLIGEGKVRIDNLLGIAEQVKAMADHGESIDRVVDGMKIVTGESRANVRTEAQLAMAERAIDRLQRSKIGGFVGPETIGAATAIALGALKAGRGSMMAAAGVTVAPGVLGGAFAAIRESKRIKQERALHSREMAQGKRYELGKRRDEIEGVRYETVAATDLSELLEGMLSDENMTPEQQALQDAYEAIAAAESRVQLSDSKNIDLISYSAVTEIEAERRRLDIARAQAKIRLAPHLVLLPQEYRERLGITDDMSVNQALERFSEPIVELNQDITAKDKAFRSLRTRRVAKAAAIGAGTSLVFGLGAQELTAFANPSYDGLVEHAIHPDAITPEGRQTLLEGLVHGQTGTTYDYIVPSSTYEQHAVLPNGGTVDIPQGYTIVDGPNGTYSIEAPDGSTVLSSSEIAYDSNGVPTPESLALLEQKHISIANNGAYVENTTTTTKTVTVAEYNKQNADATTQVKRDFWYDNDTPKPVYDKNELGLQWGGQNGNGVGADGNVKMNVSSMTEGGSYNNGKQVSWAETARDGKLKLAISASKDTQGAVYMVDIKPDGSIDIPAGSPAAKFFSVGPDGQMEFHGAYAEVAEVRTTVDGVTHIAPLATEVGDNSVKTISTEVTTTTKTYVPHLKVTPPPIEHATEYTKDVEGFGMPGIVPRRPLEKIRREGRRLPEHNGGGYDGNYGDSYRNSEESTRWQRERSPRLRDNPEADLQTGEELDFYYDQQKEARGDDYIAEIDKRIDDSDVLRTMDRNTRAIVVMPVHASAEGDNIYNTLSLYAQQDAESRDKAVILMNLNWIDDEEHDPKKAAGIKKTFDEVERFRRDHPEVKLAQFTKKWPRDWYENVRKKAMYGEIIKTLYDTAALSVRRAIKDGRMPDDQEVLMITNDADARGMSKTFFQRYIYQMDRSPRSDAFIGRIHWGIEAAKKFPGYYYAQRFQQLANELATGSRDFNVTPATIGPNSAFRVKAYAAIGGCEDRDDMGVGADSVLGHKLWAARQGGDAARANYGAHASSGRRSRRRVIAQVQGADIDTAPERLLNQGYRDGKFMPDAWGRFDQQVSRDGMHIEQLSLPEEDTNKDFESVRERIEQQYTEYINRWYGRDKRLATIALTILHPAEKQGDKTNPAWDLHEDSNGRLEFRFTHAGARQLKRSFSRDEQGRRRTLGRQLRGRYYGGWTARSKREAPLARPE